MSNLEYISHLQDLVDLHEFMDSPELTEAMELATKCIAKPDMPPSVARSAMLKMQGLSFQFRMQAATYTYIHTGTAKTPEGIKKNVYFAASEQCHNMAQTLKYLVKEQY